MTDITPKEFCAKFYPCESGREFILKHTPGPWCLQKAAISLAYKVTTSNGDIIAGVYPVEPYSDKAWTSNAQLVAASPELLKALKACREKLCEIEGERIKNGYDIMSEKEKCFQMNSEIIESGRAIAKAEGRETDHVEN